MTVIIIPTYNNGTILQACLRSIIFRTQGIDYRVIVVAQSTPVTIHHPQFQVINVPENLGYIKATNIGLKEVKPGEDVLLLNDDCIMVQDDWLAYLTRLTDEGIGAVGPRMCNVIGKQNIMYSIEQAVLRTKWLVGACTLIRSEAFQKVGFLDERFGVGMQDDLDYSIRLGREGYSLWIDNTVFVYHIGSTTFKREYLPQQWKDMEIRTRKQLIDKWGLAIVEGLLTP